MDSGAAATTITAPWLSIIGIGEDGVEGLGEDAKRLIARAETVFGGKRHLSLVEGLATGTLRVWPSPFDPSMADVIALRGRNVCVLASGDPFCHGVGATLARRMNASEIRSLPAPSAFSLAANTLGWSLSEIETISLHGRPIDLIRPLLHPGTRVIALTSDEQTPAAVAALLAGLGFGESAVTVLEALGGARQSIRTTTASSFNISPINALNVVAITVSADRAARQITLAPGLPNDLFEHDGQLTKREVRAVTLSALSPRRGELLWDVGAGSGSIAVEWLLRHVSMRAIAIEGQASRVAAIERNAAACGVPGLQIIHGTAPDALAGLERPDAIFIGGGGSEAGVAWACIESLRPGGRLVANAVTLEMESVLLTLQSQIGGSLIRLAVSRTAPVGAMVGWRAAMPVTQWCWEKP